MILLTGDKGYIGSNLKPILQDRFYYPVIGFDIKKDELEDIRDARNVVNLISNWKPDTIIHLAARTGVRDSILEPEDYFKTNVMGTYWILKYAERYGVKRVLLASSSSVYAGNNSPLSEDMACNTPLSPYGASKRSMELLCSLFPNLAITIFRPFTVYGGKNMRKEMVFSKLLTAARKGTVFYQYGDGSSTRGYTHIHDLCEGIIGLLDYRQRRQTEVFNLGGTEEIRLRDLISMVKEYYPDLKVRQVSRPEVDPLHSLASIEKARKAVGFQPKRNFKEEIKKLCLKSKK